MKMLFGVRWSRSKAQFTHNGSSLHTRENWTRSLGVNHRSDLNITGLFHPSVFETLLIGIYRLEVRESSVRGNSVHRKLSGEVSNSLSRGNTERRAFFLP